jgi:hypothetical protein
MSDLKDEARIRATAIAPPPRCDPMIAGAVGAIATWGVMYSLYSKGYLSKDWATLADVLGFVIPFLYFRRLQEKYRAAFERFKRELTEQRERQTASRS